MSDFASQLPTLSFEDLEAQCVKVDWRTEDREIVEAFAQIIDLSNGELKSVERNEVLLLEWQGREFKVPLTLTRHDRYVTLSSLAVVLADFYVFWLLKERLGDDTHSVLLVPKKGSELLEQSHSQWIEETLQKMELGHDYFSGIKVPFTGHENHNPRFQADADRVRKESEELEKALRTVLGG